MQCTPRSTGYTLSQPVDLSCRWANESLFGCLSRKALPCPAADAVFGEELLGCWPAANPLMAAFNIDAVANRAGAERLRQFVGEAGANGLGQLIGSDFLCASERWRSIPLQNRLMSPTLRYCPSCLAMGYHSMLFQHLAVDHCPGHGIGLADRCPQCEEPHTPTLRGVMKRPFECKKCLTLMIKTVVPKSAMQEQRVVDQLIGDWRRDLAVRMEWAETRASSIYFLGDLRKEHLVDAQLVRRLHRMCAWPQVSTQRWPRFSQVERDVPLADPPSGRLRDDVSPYTNLIAAEAREVLQWLIQRAKPYVEQCRALVEGAWLRPQYLDPADGRAWAAVPVALHLTVCQYSDGLFALSEEPRRQPYLGACWNGYSVQALPLDAGEHAAILLSHEILGFFALTLLRLAGRVTEGRSDIAPHLTIADIPQAAFCAPWRLHKEGRKLYLQVRPRAERTLVERLLRRYASALLKRSVYCPGLARGARDPGQTYARWSPRIPLELLHFPAGTSCNAGPARQAWEDP